MCSSRLQWQCECTWVTLKENKSRRAALVWKRGVHGCSVMGCAGGCDEFGREWNGGCFAGYDDSDVELFEGFNAAVRVDEEVVKRLMVMMRILMMNHLNATVPYAPGTHYRAGPRAVRAGQPPRAADKRGHQVEV
ncbi:hypothetical protein Tco_1484715 [Tanacetum coccineum]